MVGVVRAVLGAVKEMYGKYGGNKGECVRYGEKVVKI